MRINEYVRCVVILLKTSTIPRKDIFFVFFSIFLTLIRYPNSVLGRTGKEGRKHFLSDFLPHSIIVRTFNGLNFIARPKFEDLARFLFSETVAKWEPLSLIQPKEGETLVDLGANVGYYTLKLSPLVGNNGKIIAIEADPESCEILKKNCILNKFSNIRIHNIAITEKKGQVRLYKSDIHSGTNSIFSNKGRSDTNYITIPSTTLNDLLDESYPVIDWMKIDVEGAELKVLKGCKKTLEKTKKIIIELHEHILMNNNEKPQDILEILQQSGFKIHLFQDKWDSKTSPNTILKSDYIFAEKNE